MKTTPSLTRFPAFVVILAFVSTARFAQSQSGPPAAINQPQAVAQTASSAAPNAANPMRSSEDRVNLLDALVQLSADQKAATVKVFDTETAAIAALPPEDRWLKLFEIRQTARGRVRALLTPAQQRVYDTTPQFRGGGRTIPRPENRVTALDRQVGLTSAQKEVALQIYTEEADALTGIAPEDRAEQGAVYRQASQHQIYNLLTAEQRDKLEAQRKTEASDQTAINRLIKNAVSTSAAVTNRVGPIAAIDIRESSLQEDAVTHVRKGSVHCEVLGEKGGAKVVVYWEKKTTDVPLSVINIVVP
jgi:hypothetical protein